MQHICRACAAPALPKDELLTSDPLETTPETAPETTRGASPEALAPSPVAPRAQGLYPWALGPRREGPRASGEGPRVVSGVVSGVVSRGSEVRSSSFGSAGAVLVSLGGADAPPRGTSTGGLGNPGGPREPQETIRRGEQV